MATRAQVLDLLELGHTYETAARALHIPAGLAFMVATGLPADGGDVPSTEELVAKPVPNGSPQQLVNPPAVEPRRNQHAIDWVKRRAAHDLQRGS